MNRKKKDKEKGPQGKRRASPTFYYRPVKVPILKFVGHGKTTLADT